MDRYHLQARHPRTSSLLAAPCWQPLQRVVPSRMDPRQRGGSLHTYSLLLQVQVQVQELMRRGHWRQEHLRRTNWQLVQPQL